MFTTTHLFPFTRNLALAEFFQSADKNENENNSASAKSSFCLKRKWNEELDQNIGFLNNLEIDITDKILKVTLVYMNSVKLCNLNAMEISLLKGW